MKAIETIECTWEKFVEANPISNIEDKKFIYRGQTNGEITNKNGEIEFAEWPIISSFNRYIPSDQYSFSDFIFQQVSFLSDRKSVV